MFWFPSLVGDYSENEKCFFCPKFPCSDKDPNCALTSRCINLCQVSSNVLSANEFLMVSFSPLPGDRTEGSWKMVMKDVRLQFRPSIWVYVAFQVEWTQETEFPKLPIRWAETFQKIPLLLEACDSNAVFIFIVLCFLIVLKKPSFQQSIELELVLINILSARILKSL